MEHKEGQGVSVGLRHLTDGLEQLRHSVRQVRVGRRLGEDGPHAGGHQGGPQVPQEVLHHSGQSVDLVPGEVWTSSRLQELFSQSLHLGLGPGHSVKSHLAQAAGLDLVDAVDDEGGDHGGSLGREVGQLGSSDQGGLAGSLLGGADRDAGEGHQVSTLRMTHGLALPALVTRLPEPDSPPARPAGLSLGGEVFLLDELVLPVHAGVAAGPHDGVGGAVGSLGEVGSAGVPGSQSGSAGHPLDHRHCAEAGSEGSIAGVIPAVSR